MTTELVTVILLGLACAANPWGIMIAVLLLNARRSGVVWAYVVAWIGSLAVGVTVLIAGFGAIVESGSNGASTAAGVVELVIGLALVAWGVQRVIEDRRVPALAGSAGIDTPVDPKTPGWLRAIENISYVPAFLLGIYSATWPMVIAAAGEIVKAGGSSEQTVVLAMLFVVLGSSSVFAIAAIGTFSDRSDELLARIRLWLTTHSRAVINAILLVFGLFLMGRGLSSLA